MSLDDDTTQRDPLDLLAEEFLQRHRRGPVDVEAFVREHPAHAEGLRELLPTLIALEDVKRDRASSGSDRGRVSLPALTQLGDFRIVGELGRGGMGVVFDAVQESLGRRVALKVLPQASLLKGNHLERFRRESHIAAQLHHSNIVPVFGSGESDGYHWYAMQFIAGESLERWRQLQAEAPPRGTGAWRNRARFCARIGIQAASALHYAHGQGTLHRDIKPANLLLEANEHLWVTDFGLAKALEAEGLTYAGDLLGTLQYMAPEQFAGTYDVRSEVYALGMTLYEVLVLRPAFAGKTRSELMERIRTERPEPLRRLCPEVPEDLVVVVEKAMAREPSDRYRDAHELEQDLQAFLEDRPIRARRHSAPALVLRWCRRNRAMAALAASTVLAVVGAGVYGWIAYGVTNQALVQTKKAESEASAQAEIAKQQALIAAQQSERAETNLKLTLEAFGEVFDTLIGPDPAQALEEDEETGEQTVVVRTVVEPRDLALLKKMLAFYGQFAAQNAGNQDLQLETARANRRVGAICARLGRPEDLETAANAYTQALAGLQGMTGRDVRAQIAAVKVEFGRLQQRRLRPREAEQLFAEALDLLAGLPTAASKGDRLERARVELLLVDSMLPRRGLGRPGGGPGGPGGQGPRGGGPPGGQGQRPGGGGLDRERSRLARERLEQVTALVDGLLQEEPGNAECRVMQASTQLLAARLLGRRPEGRPEGRSESERRERDAERAAERARLLDGAVGILKEVVQAHPARDDYRFELVQALLESRAKWAPDPPGRGRGPDRGPERERSPDGGPRPEEVASAEELALLRDARTHVEQLHREQPQVLEYGRQAGIVGLELARALNTGSGSLPEAERELRLREAEQVAQKALADLAGDAKADMPLLVAELRHVLLRIYVKQRRNDEALVELQSIVDVVERQLAAMPRGELPPALRRVFERPGGEGRDRRRDPDPDALEALAERAGAKTLLERLAAIRAKVRERSGH